jgi:mono/diheme cytochrome c family protein
MRVREDKVRAPIVALIAGAIGLLPVQAALGQDEKQVEAGEAVYNDYCQTCHGPDLVNTGQTFDLRKLRKDERARFENSVTNGKNQMPPWNGVLDSGQLDAIWAYIRANANDR